LTAQMPLLTFAVPVPVANLRDNPQANDIAKQRREFNPFDRKITRPYRFPN
jgi:hypothetical protein